MNIGQPVACKRCKRVLGYTHKNNHVPSVTCMVCMLKPPLLDVSPARCQYAEHSPTAVRQCVLAHKHADDDDPNRHQWGEWVLR